MWDNAVKSCDNFSHSQNRRPTHGNRFNNSSSDERSANVKENFTRYGKQSLTLFGKQFFTSFGKDNFTLPGKEFFHLLWVASRQPSGKHIRVLQPVGLTAE